MLKEDNAQQVGCVQWALPHTYKVTAVVSIFRAERFMQGLLDDLERQTLAHELEIVIIDAASDENERDIIEQYQRRNKNIQYVRTGTRIGIYEAWNLGASLARGQYITNANADDRHRPDAFEEMVKILEENPAVGLVYADVGVTEQENEVLETATLSGEFRWPDFNPQLLFQVCYVGPQPMWRHELHKRHGFFDPSLKSAGDYEFWLRICRNETFIHLPEILGLYLLSSNGVEHGNQSLSYRESELARNRYWLTDWGLRPSPKGNFFVSTSEVTKPKDIVTSWPLVSIIMPTYSRPQMLLLALQSIVNQTYSNWEVIVVNDGGDDVENVLSTVFAGERIVYVRLPENNERSYARNIGISLAKGKYIAYLDDDDQYLPEHLETLVTFLEVAPYEVAYTDAYRVVHEKMNGRYVEKQRDVPYSYDFSRNILLRQNFIPILCVMHLRACFDRAGLFDESLNTHEDWDLWIRISEHFTFHHVKKITAEFSWRLDGTSTSSRCKKDFLATKAIIHERYGLVHHEKSENESPQKKNNSSSCMVEGLSFDCSIIIPVFNQVELTQQCLIHLAKETTDISYEVIVIDNASSDGTAEFLSSLSGDIQVIANNENLGFSKGCNQGAEVARGKLFVFLNNDTIPQSGWLGALLEEVRNHADVAVVGSKLLFPDDTIQHAGIVFNRAKGLPYQWGRGHVSSPMFNHRREFQAVTAACMLVRRESFDQVNGFDERYVNGYEDIDFCLKIKERGEKIIYQPKSCLYHLEGQSEGRQDRMSENAEYFLSRWGKVWLTDEDIVLDEERNFMRLHAQQNDVEFLLGGMGKNEEHSQRQLVVEVQKQLLGHVKGPFPQKASMVALAKKLAEYELWPCDSGVLTWGGVVCHSLGLYEHALGFLRRTLKLADEPSIRLLYVQVAIKAGWLEEAQEHLMALKHSNSFGKDACLAQGVLFLQVKDFLEAKVTFQLVLVEDSTHIKARLGLGMAEMGVGNGASAFNCFQAVLSQCPDHREAIDLLLQAGTQLKDWGKVCTQLEKFHNRNPIDCDIRFALAGVYLRMGAVEKAKYQYDALKLCAHDYDGLDELAASLSQSSKSDTDLSLFSSHAQTDIPALASEPTFLVPKPQKKHASIILGDPICVPLRLINPFEACGNDLGLTKQIVSESDVRQGCADLRIGPEEVWLTQRIDIQNVNIIKTARAGGTRIVRDLDDLLWKIPEKNPNKKCMTGEILENFFHAILYSDCVTVPTEPLKEALASLGIPSVVLPNCLISNQWTDLVPSRRVGQRPRIGWVGQWGVHMEDLEILIPIIKMLGEEVDWVFLGDIPQGGTDLHCYPEVHAMVSVEDFPAKLASLNLDLALAPLALNEFNEAKSDLRVLQYGILGYPVVATDIFPYQTAPVTRVLNDPTSWARAIRDHINNPDASEAQGEKLKQWVLSHRMFEQWASRYQEAWLGEPIKERVTPDTEHIPHVFLPKLTLNDGGGKVSYDCSIIIPVCNKLDLTSQCLTHLAKVTDGCSYEVIIVDNASTDGTGPFLSSLEGDIQIITNNSNLGFAKACNQGANAAKGKYLVFLNNDTIPLDGWLFALVDEVEQHEEVAIVGSKLLYPDGTIQHAGVVLSRSGQIPYHIFQDASQDLLAVNQRREFQAVTAACMLVRKEIFEEAGAFDEGFVNGFEDVDLCLKIRQMGKKIIYQPKSCLYHLESQTPGRKKCDEANAKRLATRWKHQWLGDEDLMADECGYIIQQYVSGDNLRAQLIPKKNLTDLTAWNRVVEFQRLLFGRERQSIAKIDDQGRIHRLLDYAEAWPSDIGVLSWVGSVCEILNCEQEAMKFWEKLLTIGNYSDARLSLARGKLKRGEFAESQKHLDVLLKVSSPGVEAWIIQGILFMQMQNFLEAKYAFDQALTIEPVNRKSRMGSGMASLGLGEISEAWNLFEDLIVTDPDDVEAIRCLIQAGTASQRWETLAWHLTKFIERNPADCDIRFALAGVQFRAGDSGKAKEHLTWLRLVRPDFEGLEDLEKLLVTPQLQNNLLPVS